METEIWPDDIFNSILFSETFQSFSLPARQFIMDMRISLAKELLRSTIQTVYETAGITGFSSSMDFCRNFKKHCNLTPLEYRNKFK